ncbi:uncharacterized protein V1516DRAFT_677151 [Lipomyces oligophaga]|uniref:uncharacterized protein n=1 Tax=Lipomyces oligophaga TaxID=45792 RepID=UPI0034CD619F
MTILRIASNFKRICGPGSNLRAPRVVSRMVVPRYFNSSTFLTKEYLENHAIAITPSDSGAIQDFDVLQDLPRPPMAIDIVLDDGFKLSDSSIFSCEDGTLGLAVIDGVAFAWDFAKYCSGLDIGLVDISEQGLGMLDLLQPRPEMVLIGLGGKKGRILAEKSRQALMRMGYRTEVSDTTSAANNFELLATERPRQVIALLLPRSA